MVTELPFRYNPAEWFESGGVKETALAAVRQLAAVGLRMTLPL